MDGILNLNASVISGVQEAEELAALHIVGELGWGRSAGIEGRIGARAPLLSCAKCYRHFCAFGVESSRRRGRNGVEGLFPVVDIGDLIYGLIGWC